MTSGINCLRTTTIIRLCRWNVTRGVVGGRSLTGYLSYLSLAHPVTLFTVQVTSVTPVTPCTPSREYTLYAGYLSYFSLVHPETLFTVQVTSVTPVPPHTPSREYFVRRLPQLPFTGAPSYPVYSADYLSYPPAHPVASTLYAGYLSYLSLAHPVTLFRVQVTSVTPVTPLHT